MALRACFQLCVVAVVLCVSLADDCSYARPQKDKFRLCISSIKTVEVGQHTSLRVHTNPAYYNSTSNSTEELLLNLTVKHGGIVEPIFNNTIYVTITGGNTTEVMLRTIGAGITVIGFTYSTKEEEDLDPIVRIDDAVTEVSVVHWLPLNIIIAIVGWMYFLAWSVSFYPQIILNFQRRSVEGLNFDFLAYNITGFLAYGMFNIGLYWIPEVQAEYYNKNPGGVNPVLLNDVVFTLHAIAATAFTIFQCFIFERAGQRISYVAWVLLSMMWLTIIISLFVAVGGKLSWLEYLYILSYIKLAVTIIKYVPQAYMNCRRRSTEGWSIGNVLLDFTGGTFSILQMFLLSYNYDDWSSIFGDPTKFGLGFFSILFDLLFMLQHYVLFRNPHRKGGYQKIDAAKEPVSADGLEKSPLLGSGEESHEKSGALKRLLTFFHIAPE